MQVNRMNQPTNFGNAYMKNSDGSWSDSEEWNSHSTAEVKDIFEKSISKKGILVDADEIRRATGAGHVLWSESNWAIALTDKEASAFSALTRQRQKRNFVKSLLGAGVWIVGKFKATAVEDAEFLSKHLA